MSIGKTLNPSAYSIRGRPLGVQPAGSLASSYYRTHGIGGGGSAASQLLGGGSASTLFATAAAASNSISVSPNQMATKALQDEIDRTQGFRTNLSVAEKKQLADLQGQISDIEKLASTRALTDDEVQQRADLYVQSYAILGKDYVDVSNDSFVQDKLSQIDDLLATKPVGADADRLANLQTVEQNVTDEINAAGEKGATESLTRQLISVKSQIADLTAPRKFSDLTPDELQQYDDLASAINAHVGQELQLPSAKRLKIERLQTTIDAINSGGTSSPGGGALAILQGGLNIFA